MRDTRYLPRHHHIKKENNNEKKVYYVITTKRKIHSIYDDIRRSLFEVCSSLLKLLFFCVFQSIDCYSFVKKKKSVYIKI